MKMYSVYDAVAKEFGPPVLARNNDVASRMYVQLLAEHRLVQADFILYWIGEYDTETGLVTPVEAPEKVDVVYRKNAGLEEVM